MSWGNSPPNYSDGVPVKISEKFRPPPKITVPQSVIQRLSQAEAPSRQYTYSFQLEENVLKHISEWKSVLDHEKHERQERIRTKDLARLKQLEEEQKVKLNEISYPNTDDLSSSSDEDEKEETQQSCRNVTQSQSNPIPGHFSPLNSFDTILTPTPIFAEKKGIDANEQQIDSNIPKNTNHKNSFNYSEFENGMESNPFDNMELSAIDDINILAQVLNLNSPAAGIKSGTAESKVESEPQTTPSYQKLPTSTSTLVNENSQLSSHEINSNNEYYKNYGSYYNYGTYNTASNTMIPTTSSNYTNLNENYISQPSSGYPQNVPYDFFYNPINQNMYAPNYGYNNSYAYNNTFSPNHLANIPQSYGDQINQQQPSLVEPKSKSKSVPDIVKQLDDEIKESELRRIRNNSQSNSTNDVKCDEAPSPSSQQEYSQLPQAAQKLVKRIHNMGFPLERVAKIVKKLGPDDKKVVEHLIPLSELLDFGFGEDQISDALLKFNNNKDKALDYLIS